jgi:hypothetical protein
MRCLSIAIFPFFSLLSTMVVAGIAVGGLLGTKQVNLYEPWEFVVVSDMSDPNNPAGRLAYVAYS